MNTFIFISEESARCMLCQNAPCTKACAAGMGSDVGQNSELVTFYTAYVKRSVSIPVIPKMTPNITSMNVPATGAISSANRIKKTK